MPRTRAARASRSPRPRSRRLPIDGSDLATIATLAPGVVGLSATDTTATAFSVAGQRQSLNSTTVDGLSFGGASVPTEAVRNIRVVTNSYDVSRGQFTGGQIATTTRGGTNDARRLVRRHRAELELRVRHARAARVRPAPQSVPVERRTSAARSSSDKLFTFTAVQLNRRYDDLISAPQRQPHRRSAPLGITPTPSASSSLTSAQLGAPGHRPQCAGRSRGITSVVVFQRFDYLLSDDETLTLRGDFRATAQDGSRSRSSRSPPRAPRSRSAGGGLLLGLTSHLGDATINDFRVYVSHSQTTIAPYLQMPAGRVTVMPGCRRHR